MASMLASNPADPGYIPGIIKILFGEIQRFRGKWTVETASCKWDPSSTNK